MDSGRFHNNLSKAAVLAFRLRRHRLDARAPRSQLARVVDGICGVQAQFLRAGQLALWNRVNGITLDDIERALVDERSLVRTWAMRGTVHLLAAADLVVYLKGLLRSRLRHYEHWYAKGGLSSEQIESLTEAVRAALSERPVTRKALSEHVRQKLGTKAAKWVQHSWGGIVKLACARGFACFGPSQRQEITFVDLARWLPKSRLENIGEAEAEEELLRRYLGAFGPATLTDFAYWSGLQVKEAEEILARVTQEVDTVSVADKIGFVLKQDYTVLRATQPRQSVRLLPSFDQYLLGHRDKSLLVNLAHYKNVYRKAGWISQTLLVNGRVKGIWAHRRKGRRLLIQITPFAKLSRNVRQEIEGEASSLAQFLRLETTEVRTS